MLMVQSVILKALLAASLQVRAHGLRDPKNLLADEGKGSRTVTKGIRCFQNQNLTHVAMGLSLWAVVVISHNPCFMQTHQPRDESRDEWHGHCVCNEQSSCDKEPRSYSQWQRSGNLQEYVDNKVNEAMAYQSSVSSSVKNTVDKDPTPDQTVATASNVSGNGSTSDPSESGIGQIDPVKRRE